MKTRNVIWFGLASFLVVPLYAADSAATAPPGAPPEQPVMVQPSPSNPPGYFPAGTITPPGPQGPAHLGPAAAEVMKLSNARVGEDVIQAYVKNCQAPFHLSADGILRLKEAGVTSPVIAAMLTHDSDLREQNTPQPPPYGYDQRLYGPGQQPPPGPVPGQPPAQGQPYGPPPGQPPAQQQFYAPPPGEVPPPPQTEVIPVSPGVDYTWYPGYWGWNNGWVWAGGYWGMPGISVGVGWGWPGGGWGWVGR